jgi:hypothetical protein
MKFHLIFLIAVLTLIGCEKSNKSHSSLPTRTPVLNLELLDSSSGRTDFGVAVKNGVPSESSIKCVKGEEVTTEYANPKIAYRIFKVKSDWVKDKARVVAEVRILGFRSTILNIKPTDEATEYPELCGDSFIVEKELGGRLRYEWTVQKELAGEVVPLEMVFEGSSASDEFVARVNELQEKVQGKFTGYAKIFYGRFVPPVGEFNKKAVDSYIELWFANPRASSGVLEIYAETYR